jgi:hypothetical protein
MSVRRLPAALGVLTLVLAGPAAAGGAKWTAVSTTAMSITGDIEMTDDSITFQNGARIGLRPVADAAGIFTLDPPTANPVLLNGNYLCGSNVPPKYLALPSDGTTAYLLAFDGPDVPKLAADPLDQTGICALYTYQR